MKIGKIANREIFCSNNFSEDYQGGDDMGGGDFDSGNFDIFP